MRLAAHRISDKIYQRLTGEKGIFSTRVAYVDANQNHYAFVGFGYGWLSSRFYFEISLAYYVAFVVAGRKKSRVRFF